MEVPYSCKDCENKRNTERYCHCVYPNSDDAFYWYPLKEKVLEVTQNVKDKTFHPDCPRKNELMIEKLKQL